MKWNIAFEKKITIFPPVKSARNFFKGNILYFIVLLQIFKKWYLFYFGLKKQVKLQNLWTKFNEPPLTMGSKYLVPTVDMQSIHPRVQCPLSIGNTITVHIYPLCIQKGHSQWNLVLSKDGIDLPGIDLMLGTVNIYTIPAEGVPFLIFVFRAKESSVFWGAKESSVFMR